MRKKFILLEVMFWFVLSKLLHKLTRAIDWLYQYALGRSLILHHRMTSADKENKAALRSQGHRLHI